MTQRGMPRLRAAVARLRALLDADGAPEIAGGKRLTIMDRMKWQDDASGSFSLSTGDGRTVAPRHGSEPRQLP